MWKAEGSVREGNMKQLFDVTKKLVERYSRPEILAKNKEGRSANHIQEQRNRWVEH